MAEPLTIRCAAESLARDEPLAGTASRVGRWLVVEQPGAWGREALTDSDLDAEVGAALDAAGRRAGVRVLLGRRPGWRKAGPTRRVFLAHTAPSASWIEQIDLPTDDTDALVGLDLAAAARPEPPGLGEPGPATLFLVCTNGRHDPCCADRGRPIIRRLAADGVEHVWECSHIGGDRFAGNILALPHGIYYGRVEADDAPGLIDDHRAGLVSLPHYRGRSCYPPLMQVAEAHVREALGERRIDAVAVIGTEERPGDQVVVRVARAEGPPVEVVVARDRAEPAQLTCRAAGPSTPWSYRVVTPVDPVTPAS